MGRFVYICVRVSLSRLRCLITPSAYHANARFLTMRFPVSGALWMESCVMFPPCQLQRVFPMGSPSFASSPFSRVDLQFILWFNARGESASLFRPGQTPLFSFPAIGWACTSACHHASMGGFLHAFDFDFRREMHAASRGRPA